MQIENLYNQRKIRDQLARSVGGEEALAGFYAHRTMRCTQKRAARELDGATETAIESMERIHKALAGEDLEQHAAFNADEWLGRFAGKWSAWQRAGSQVLNWMVTGPANFPVARNQKRIDTEQRRYDEFAAFYKGAPAAEVKRAKRARAEALGPGGIARGELEDAQRNLAGRERNQHFMKEVNKLIRKHKLKEGDGEQLVALAAEQELEGLSPPLAAEILRPAWDGAKIGFASYQLQNNSAEIRRLRDRVQLLEKKAAAIEAGPEPTERQFGEIRLVKNIAIDRVQLVFPGKPSAEARRALKGRGFRWSPREGAWQRQLTPAGVNVAEALAGQLSAC